MSTKAYKVVKGEKGYVPVYSNSHGGTNLGKAVNGLTVYMIVEIPEEYKYVQIDERVIQDAKPEIIAPSETGEYWIERSHLEETASAHKKFKLINYDFGTCVVEVEEL